MKKQKSTEDQPGILIQLVGLAIFITGLLTTAWFLLQFFKRILR